MGEDVIASVVGVSRFDTFYKLQYFLIEKIKLIDSLTDSSAGTFFLWKVKVFKEKREANEFFGGKATAAHRHL